MNTKVMLLGALALGTVLQGYGRKTLHESVELSKGQEIRIDLKFGDEITIIPVKGRRVELNGSIEVNDGEDDDAYTLEVFNHSDRLIIDSHLDKDLEPYRKVETYDADGELISTSWSTEIRGHFEIQVPVDHALVIETINATLNLELMQAPLTAKTINGEINLTLDEKSQMNLKVSSIHGDCMTDIPLSNFKEVSRKHDLASSKAEFELNGGGMPVKLKTINGWMFLMMK